MRRIRWLAALGAVLALSLQMVPAVMAEGAAVENTENGEETGGQQGREEGDNLYKAPAYLDYAEEYASAAMGGQKIVIEAGSYTDGKGVSKLELDGVRDAVSVTEDGYIQWKVDIPKSARYNMLIRYYPIEGKGSAIERALYINGTIPFKEAGNLVFTRMWENENGEKMRTDSAGNDVRPSQTEYREWRDYIAADSTGYVAEKLAFYFEKGENILKLESIREPVAIASITLFAYDEPENYAEKMNGVSKDDPAMSSGERLEPIQAEDTALRSDITIYQIADKISAATMPQSAQVTKLNTIGADKWQLPGQWITWKFKVEKSGYYKLAPRFRQNIYSGGYTSRKMYLDGEVPFKEAENLKFNYSTDWQLDFLGDENGDYVFYLEAGTEHEMTWEVVLGDMAPIIRRVEAALNELNAIYRKILMITGPNPDLYRDYSFDDLIPQEIERLGQQADELQDICDRLKEMSGSSGEYTAVLEQLVFQLRQMHEKPSKIANNFKNFKTNIGSLGSWLLTARQQPLQLDYFLFVPANEEELPSAEAPWYKNLWFGFQTFLQSFFRDYNAIAGLNEGESAEKTLKVWIATGRDQAQIIRTMADDSFSPQFHASVDLQLTAAGTLLPATLAGIGPDISLSTDGTYPVNFAVRKGVIDLTEFDDFDEVAGRFHPSALVPYTFLDHTYALPETQSFPMLFYRKDVLEELGLEVPKTWDDLYAIIPELKKNNMEIGFPTSYAGFMLMLYQRGGELYLNNGEQCNLNSDVALDAFQELCDLFTQYSFPVTYDFANRFRTGEMPLGIQDYTLYNQLTVFAPEIKGLWDFTAVPGYVDENGHVNQTVYGSGTAVMMMRGVQDKELAWEFMKWWTSAETQGRFGLEMESILGASAKQPTANMEAASKLPWSSKEYATLKESWENVKGVPEVPGSYYTSRNIDFAFTGVYNKQLRPVDTLLTYIDEINRELTRKRVEFGLE